MNDTITIAEHNGDRSRRWAIANREKVREHSRKYRLANPEKVLDAARKYRAANPDRVREASLKWYRANREKSLAAHRKYSAANREKKRNYHRKWRGLPTATRPCPSACECCGGHPNGRGALHLDHCHETGKFRGWLCSDCNLGIGRLGDSIVGLEQALTYLRLMTSND